MFNRLKALLCSSFLMFFSSKWGDFSSKWVSVFCFFSSKWGADLMYKNLKINLGF